MNAVHVYNEKIQTRTFTPRRLYRDGKNDAGIPAKEAGAEKLRELKYRRGKATNIAMRWQPLPTPLPGAACRPLHAFLAPETAQFSLTE